MAWTNEFGEKDEDYEDEIIDASNSNKTKYLAQITIEADSREAVLVLLMHLKALNMNTSCKDGDADIVDIDTNIYPL